MIDENAVKPVEFNAESVERIQKSIVIGGEAASHAITKMADQVKELSSDFEICVRFGGVRICVSLDIA